MAAGAGAAPGQELCPHCRRPFKRLRQHLPHCKAAPPPAPAPGTSPRPAPASASRPAPSPGPRPAAGTERGSGLRPSPASAPRPGSAPGTSPRPARASAPGPGSAPGTSPRPARASAPGPGSAPGTSPRPAPACAPGPEPSPGSVPAGSGQPREAAVTGGPAGSGRSAEPAVQDVARSLDLHPEEVEDVPKRLEKGAKVVIEQHRARVVREKEPRSRAGAAGSREGPDPDPAPQAQRRKTAPKSKRKDTRSQGAVENGTGSSEGEKSSLKATKTFQELTEHRNCPGDLFQQEGRDKSTAGEERVHLEAGLGSKAPVCALHPKKLHLSVAGALGQGTGTNGLRDSREQMAAVSEPVLSSGRAPGLALLHSPQFQPTCPSRASGRSSWAAATGLEWFPHLYPEDEGLRIFPGRRFQGDVGLAVVAPQGCSSEGQRGPLSERPLLEVRLGELHSWISTCNFSPQGLLGAVQKAWSSYCAKYIHVRQGGPAGISMLLAGYCLLSYGWNYQHLKRHRWRKYH